MKPARVDSASIQADGLRAVCDTPATLPDLCHHAEYRIYVSGQYVESAGNVGSNAQRVFEFYQRRRRGKSVEVRTLACKVPGCTWGQS
jgi:hypothetical protein